MIEDVLTRRSVLSLAALALLSGCGPKTPAAAPKGTALALSSASALVSAANVVWFLELAPRAFFAHAQLGPATAILIPADRFEAFRTRHGGIDLRQIDELVIAKYPKTELTLARVSFDPVRVEASFKERVIGVEGRAIDPATPDVTRLWGEAHSERTQLAMFGHELVAVERGQVGAIRISELFARGTLKRSLPVLRAEPFARARALLGASDARIFAPGPFEGEWQKALGGLLRATTAVAGGVRVREEAGRAVLDARMVLLGSWGGDEEAAVRLAAGIDVILSTGFAKLIGVSKPVQAPKVTREADALVVDGSWDAMTLAKGLHDAVDAEVSEIFQRA